MKVSVALATYNGAKYLQQQLESFTTQTRLPDELVITDDCSVDETVQIIEEFASTADFEVRVFHNDKNVGYAENFSNTIARCRGDVIFMSDQDDVWYEDKIAVVCDIFERDDSILVVSNNADIADEALTPTGVTILDNARSIGLKNYLVHGCCAAFRRCLMPVYLPVPGNVTHDWWLHCVATNLEIKKILNRPLQAYRRHEQAKSDAAINSTRKISRWRHFSSVLGSKDRKTHAVSTMKQRIDELRTLQNRLSTNQDIHKQCPSIPAISVKTLPMRIESLESREQILSRPIFFRFLFAIRLYFKGTYRYCGGLRNVVKDII